jgi:capsular polysaccharide transport system permease protein
MTTVIKRNKWEVWRDVIFALFAREIRTGFNDKFGLSWAIINPVAFIFILSFIRGRISGGETHNMPTFTFMAIGILLIQTFLQTLNSTASSIKKNKALFAFRQVQPLSAVIASALFELLVKTFVVLGIVIIMYFLSLEINLDNSLLFLYCFVLLWLSAVSLGLFFGIFELFINEVSRIRELATRPLFFISGVFFSLQDFPEKLWPYLDWNPILHAIELTRNATYSSYSIEGISLNYLSFITIILLFSSLAVYKVFWKQAISR